MCKRTLQPTDGLDERPPSSARASELRRCEESVAEPVTVVVRRRRPALPVALMRRCGAGDEAIRPLARVRHLAGRGFPPVSPPGREHPRCPLCPDAAGSEGEDEPPAHASCSKTPVRLPRLLGRQGVGDVGG